MFTYFFLPKQFFRKLDTVISNFIWAGKTPRVCKTLLQREHAKGGLGLPNFQCFYWAANVHKIMLWMTGADNSWIHLETNSCHASSLKALVCSSLPSKPRQFTSNPIVIATLNIWQQIRQQFGWRGLPLATPLCNNHLFQPARTDPRFSKWCKLGLSSLCDLYVDGIFASFTQLSSLFNLQSSDMYGYFQIRNFVKHNTSAFPHIPAASGIDFFLI